MVKTRSEKAAETRKRNIEAREERIRKSQEENSLVNFIHESTKKIWFEILEPLKEVPQESWELELQDSDLELAVMGLRQKCQELLEVLPE